MSSIRLQDVFSVTIFRLPRRIKEVPPLNWCLALEQLLKEESISQLLLILSAMRKKHGHK